jgi:hypothetical protein
MSVVETQRTVVKSIPELWAELSDVAALSPMLGQFGEIRITRLEPETAIEWASERAQGSVELAPSGFGTRVRLTAALGASRPAATATAYETPRVGFFARLLRRRPPAPATAATVEPAAVALDASVAEGALTAILDELGSARHRPFSRGPAASPPPA